MQAFGSCAIIFNRWSAWPHDSYVYFVSLIMFSLLLTSVLFLSCLLLFSIIFYRWLWELSSPRNRKAPRLSKDPALMRPEYDVVVLGSGYGGGVAASRLARTGKRVCLLERGEEKWPGEYPHTLKAALRETNFQDRRPGKRSSFGKTSGLFQTCRGEGQYVLSGCGLGGTSLVNAGVFLQADDRTFQGPEWPAEIREKSGGMRQCKLLVASASTQKR